MPLGTKAQLPSVQLDRARDDLGNATQASTLSTKAGPYALSDGETLIVDVDGGGDQTVTFNAVDFDDIANATTAEVAAVIANALLGAIAADESGDVRVTSEQFGALSSLAVTGGTAAADFEFVPVVAFGDDATDVTQLINRIPEPTEGGVPLDSDMEVEIHDTAGAPAAAGVEVRVDGTLAYDGDGGGFQSGFTGATSSPDAHTFRVVVDPDVDFASDSAVTVRVVVAGGSTAVDESYAFTTVDLTLPTVAGAAAQEKKIVRVTFDEAVLQVSPSNANDALNPANYAFARGAAPAVDVVAVEVTPVSATEVDVEADIELSFGLPYTVTVSSVEDLFGNVITAPDDDAGFTSFAPDVPEGRRFQLIEQLPQLNRSEDATEELAAFVAVLQDVFDLLLCEVDRFTDILDPDLAPEAFLDAMLLDLGNPFSFAALDEVDKRRLLRILIDIYKQKGTEAGIINVINFFLGVLVTIDVFNGEGWELAAADNPTLDGQSPPAGPGDELSSATTEPADAASLGPGERRLLYSFIVVSPVDLTPTQRDRIVQIVELMKPAHTHLVAISEPATGPVPIDHLELGLSELGGPTGPGTWTLH